MDGLASISHRNNAGLDTKKARAIPFTYLYQEFLKSQRVFSSSFFLSRLYGLLLLRQRFPFSHHPFDQRYFDLVPFFFLFPLLPPFSLVLDVVS